MNRGEFIMKALLKKNIFFAVFISIIGLFMIGCGSSVENPANSDEDEELFDSKELNVDVRASQRTVSPGETVELTATVEPVRSNQLFFKWVNVTGYGTLSNTDQTSTTWTAPTNLDRGEVKVEVIHLVVIAVSQTISVTNSKVDTNTDIYTATETVPLTVMD